MNSQNVFWAPGSVVISIMVPGLGLTMIVIFNFSGSNFQWKFVQKNVYYFLIQYTNKCSQRLVEGDKLLVRSTPYTIKRYCYHEVLLRRRHRYRKVWAVLHQQEKVLVTLSAGALTSRVLSWLKVSLTKPLIDYHNLHRNHERLNALSALLSFTIPLNIGLEIHFWVFGFFKSG